MEQNSGFMETNVPLGLGCCCCFFFPLMMDLQGSESVRAGNSTLGDLAHLPSVFKSCIRFFKVYHKRSYSSATAALSCNKNVFSVCTLN